MHIRYETILYFSYEEFNEVLPYKWQEIEGTDSYRSVILFKNHGPYSGGSISHPHLQIIGMKEVDYHQNITMANFEGTNAFTHNGVELTSLRLSNHRVYRI